jgi:hypothetical protein
MNMRLLRVLPPVCGVLAFTLMTGLVASSVWADEGNETLFKPPPKDATVLFNAKNQDLSGWTTLDGKPAQWKVENDYMEVVPGKSHIRTKETFGPDFQLHVEFWIPLMADKKDQARGNSGVYLQGRYEIQVLDSYMNETYKGGECAAMYLLVPTMKNACKPPEQWQTYDITFHAPRVDDAGKVTKKGHVTVVQNGEKVTDGDFDKVTGGNLDNDIGKPGCIFLQDHGCKVRFRNIWIKPLEK